jgi:hypothetical protein
VKDLRGLAVLILAIGVAACLVLAFVTALVEDQAVPQWVANMLFTLLGGVIGVVASYVKRTDEPGPHLNRS